MGTHGRTNIVIDQELMEETLAATGLKTKREAVDLGLRTVLRLSRQGEIKSLRGIRKTIDTFIATRCIEDNLQLLCSDRDFEPFVTYLGLISALGQEA